MLILGAGASAPYGYPLGAGLVNTIVGLTDADNRSGLFPVLLGDQSFREQVGDFHARLLRSETGSIDDFLESNRDYGDLGKVCIAAALTLWGPPAGHAPQPERHWYRYLWERLRQGAGQARSGPGPLPDRVVRCAHPRLP